MSGTRQSASSTSPLAVRAATLSLLAWIAAAVVVLAATVAFRDVLDPTFSPAVYLPIHALAELSAVLVGFATFAVQVKAASTPVGPRDARALFVGITCLGIAVLDLLHLFAFPGMPGVIRPSSPDQGIFYWLVARAWATVSLAAAALVPATRRATRRSSATLGAVTLLVVAGALAIGVGTDWAQAFYRPGQGLTPLKVRLEYAIAALCLGGAALHWVQFRRTGDRFSAAIIVALVITAVSEVTFTLYTSPYDVLNLLGHLYKVAAFYLLFNALFATALVRPYVKLDATLGELEASNRELALLRDHVEGELADTIARLEVKSAAEQRARAASQAAERRLRSLQSVTDATLASADLDGMLLGMLTRLREVLAGDEATVLLLGDDGDTLVTRASVGLEREAEQRLAIPFGHGVAGRVAAERRPRIIDDLAKEPEVVSAAVRATVASMIVAPLLADGRVVGVVHVGTRAARRFTPDDLRLLEIVAERAAASVERARLYAELEAAIEAAPDPILVYTPSGRVQRVNAAAERLLGPDAAAAADLSTGGRPRSLRVRLPDGTDLAPDELPVARALHGEAVHGALFVVERGARRVHATVSAAPIRDLGGHLLGAVVAASDVTALRELEEQREDLLRSVSHDLRTPLTAIQLQAQRLQRLLRDPASARPREAADAIVGASRRMGAMIQDLVDSARLEAGQLKLDRQPVDLRSLVEDLLQSGALDATRVDVELASALPSVAADPNRLERILANLLSNALKYSPAGARVRLIAGASGGEVAITVEDLGVGIPADELPRIFERFYRARSAGRAEGLGMGLYIVRKLVEAHGGRIQAASVPGQGSTFTVTLPAVPALAVAP